MEWTESRLGKERGGEASTKNMGRGSCGLRQAKDRGKGVVAAEGRKGEDEDVSSVLLTQAFFCHLRHCSAMASIPVVEKCHLLVRQISAFLHPFPSDLPANLPSGFLQNKHRLQLIGSVSFCNTCRLTRRCILKS